MEVNFFLHRLIGRPGAYNEEVGRRQEEVSFIIRLRTNPGPCDMNMACGSG